MSLSQLLWVPNDLLKGRYSVTPLPSNHCWLTWWRTEGGHPADLCSWASFLEYFDNILKVDLCHQTSYFGYPNDILKVITCHLAGYPDQYWWRGWLPHKGGALIVSNQQLNFLGAYRDNRGWQTACFNKWTISDRYLSGISFRLVYRCNGANSSA